MQKQIKFIYALLIITIMGGGMGLVLQNKIDNFDSYISENISNLELESQTFEVVGTLVLFWEPNQVEIENINKKLNNEDSSYIDDFNEAYSDDIYYENEALKFFEKKNIKIITTDKRYLRFVKDNGDKIILDRNSYNKLNTWAVVFLFDGKQDPLRVDIDMVESSYQKYFKINE